MSASSAWKTISKLGWSMFLAGFSAAAIYLAWVATTRDETSLTLLAGALACVAAAMVPVGKLVNPTARRHAAAAADAGATLVLTRSWFSVAVTITMCAALAGSCALGLAAGMADPFWRAATWSGLVLFAALAVASPWRGRRVWLRLSAEGLDYSEFKIGPIAWVDIRSVVERDRSAKRGHRAASGRRAEVFSARVQGAAARTRLDAASRSLRIPDSRSNVRRSDRLAGVGHPGPA